MAANGPIGSDTGAEGEVHLKLLQLPKRKKRWRFARGQRSEPALYFGSGTECPKVYHCRITRPRRFRWFGNSKLTFGPGGIVNQVVDEDNGILRMGNQINDRSSLPRESLEYGMVVGSVSES